MKSIGTKEIKTERLLLRKVELNDADAMFNGWCNDNVVTRYLPWDVHSNVGVTKFIVNDWVKQYDDVNTYRWMVTLNNDPIGTIDVVNLDFKNSVAEIGYCYKKDTWGMGYATEALKGVINYLFNEVDVEVIVAKHLSNNLASGKVMEKSGMRYEATLKSRVIDKLTGDRVDYVYYIITKDML